MASESEHAGVHPANEKYLVTIFVLEEEEGEVIQARLAERLGHTAPTVSEMVHRLADQGYVKIEGRVITLTSAGRDLATKVVRKHCLVARLMTDIVGVPWHTVHAEAGRWEHVISDEVAERLMVVLGNPTTCPHGNPIPGSCAQKGPTSLLTDAEVGQQVCFARITELAKFDDDALRYLEDHGFIPGAEATVSARGPDGSLVLDVGSETVVLGASMAKLLCVGPVATAGASGS
ncbi:MAG: metal-dependent transcriptional regulator [Acidimicrobiales bacterium]